MKSRQTTLLLVDLEGRFARRYCRDEKIGAPVCICVTTLGASNEPLLPLGSKLGLALIETFRKRGTLRLASTGGKRGKRA